MKNIHVLKTDKPSRLFIDIDNDKLTITNNPIGGEHFMNQNIYITSDEEIKEGDWYFDGTDLVHKKTKYNDALVDGNKNAKKIILTTDKDLIKDGVQAIDDEFLEWYVKNPSCEEVEVEQEILKLVHNPNYVNHTPDGDGIYLTPKSEDLQYGETLIEDNVIDYKIIIPKEEPKQETLEEYIERETKGLIEPNLKAAAKAFLSYGAKWQQKQDKNKFSEEDMLLAFETGRNFQLTGENNFKELIEQLKK